MNTPLINDPLSILVTLSAVVAFFFWLEKLTKWKLFQFLPPLIFIYAVPMAFSSLGWLATASPMYDWMKSTVLPFIITLMLLKVDVRSAVRVMGRGILVMLCGTLGVIVGAPLAYLVVRGMLEPTGWKAFGALAGSWIGGTGNMAAVAEGIEASGAEVGLAVLGDTAVYIVWLPILLGSKGLAQRFHRWVRVDEKRLQMLEQVASDDEAKPVPSMLDFIYLIFLGFTVTWAATHLAAMLPQYQPILTTSSWRILLVTTLGIFLSLTPARRLAGSHEFSMALLYLFVANMGARADLSELQAQAVWFILGAFIWIFFHGLFCLGAAKLFRVDIHSTVIASAANIGGAASAPVVAAHHNPRLVPVSILMALLGYAIGNYGALLAAWLCQLLQPAH